MKTTNEGFLVNTLRRIPRHGVKALAAGALLIAAALPLAVASSASATTPPTLTGTWGTTPVALTTTPAHLTAAATAGTTTTLTVTANTYTAGDIIVDDSTSVTNVHVPVVLGVVQTTVTGTSVVLTAPSASSGASGDVIEEFAPLGGIGEGGAPSPGTAFDFSGTGFIANASNVTLASGDPDLAFSNVSETSPTWGSATVTTAASTTNGSETLTLTDGNGTSNTLAGAFTIDPDPTVTAVSPSSVYQGQSSPAITITGTNIVAGATAYFTSTVDGTPLGVAPPAGITCNAVNAGGTTCTLNAADFNAVNGYTNGQATAGNYTITLVNTDGGSGTSAAIFTVTPFGITDVSPSAIPENTSATPANSFLTITGAGFEYGATVTLTPAANTGITEVANTALVTSSTTITVEVTDVSATATGLVEVTVQNPAVINGGNDATFNLSGAIGVGIASTVAPVISGATTSATLTAGGVPATTTFTGTGFSQYSTVQYYAPGSTTASTHVTAVYVAGNTGTSLSATAQAQTMSTAGTFGASVTNTAAVSKTFPAALTVAGPVITSQTPLTVGAPVGTVVTLTGTGFINTDSSGTTGFVASPTGSLTGVMTYVNATTYDFIVTAKPDAADITAASVGTPSEQITQTVGGVITYSPVFKIIVSAAPAVTSVTYATAPINDVGVGATAQVVTFHGTGFATGVTIGSFVNGSNIADPDVTATVTGVNAGGTAITATIAIAAGDTNIAVGYTVTNTNGGTAAISAVQAPIVIGAGPTITSLTPATSPASTTTSFTIVGTNFETGAIVNASADGTCGTPSAATATTLTVACTFGAATSTAASLVVVNPDGGAAKSAAVIAALTPPAPPAPHATGEAGSAIVGRTVGIAVAGVGFYGQPKVTSTGASVKAVVSKDTGTLLTVQVTVGATTGAGEHTLTFTLANGKVFKVNYLIVK